MNVPHPASDPDKAVGVKVPLSTVAPPPEQRHRYQLENQYDLPDSLDSNPPAPRGELKRIKPVHQMMAYMGAAGRTVKEIAEASGYSYSQVREVLAQPAIRDEMKRIVEESGSNFIDTVLSQEVIPSIQTLVAVRDDTKEKGSTRVSAANSLLDRFLGKPTTKIESTNYDGGKIEDSVEAKLAELQRIESQMRAAGASITPGTGVN